MLSVLLAIVSILFVINIIIVLFPSKNKVSTSQYEILKAAKATCDEQLNVAKSETDELKSNIAVQNKSLIQLEKDKSFLEAEKRGIEERINQHKIDLEALEQRFKLEFQNISNSILSTQTKTFSDQSKLNIEIMLKPFRDDLDKINKSLADEGKSKATLVGSIDEIIKSSTKIYEQSANLTNALKGDSKVQGGWGEILLEKILEESGLRPSKDYILQGADIRLRNPDDENKYVKPDVIVNLPENKHIIIDSKMSLTSYERFFSENNEVSKSEHLNNHLKSVKNHVNELSSKRYQDIDTINSPEFVLMFIGIEGAYALAIQKDSDLISYAWNKGVVIVCPSTLFATLRTISSLWRLDMQNHNAVNIAKIGGALYDKIVGFVEDMQKLGTQLKNANDCHASAMNKLSQGKGNILNRVQRMQELGVKSSKKLPLNLLDVGDENDEAPTA